jgi:undecaprenyl phosphate N,N'-diacetylbacillosamine 1-phosphate transferase
MYKQFFKRFLDFWVALLGLLLASPLLLLTMLVLGLSNKGSGIFFVQERPGLNSRIFKLLKFKTMTDERDGSGNLLPDKDRFTRVGSFIRASSIDELPQLVNVLRGEMSLIGPRPLMPHMLPLYTPEQARRHEVRPGITGWAQVHGRGKMKFSKKFEYDVYYVDHFSFWLDLRIFIKTIRNVFLRENVGRGAEEMSEVDDLGFAERLQQISDKTKA